MAKRKNKKKPNIKQLKYPLWFTITFYVLTVGAPLFLIMVKGYQSENPAFRITFGVLTTLVLIWTFARRFIIVKKEDELRKEKLQLEHEYEAGIGKAEKVKYLWYNNEIWLSLFNTIHIVAWGSLLLLVFEGLADGLIKLKGVSAIIAIIYLAAYILKFLTITVLKNKEYKEDCENGTEQPKQEGLQEDI